MTSNSTAPSTGVVLGTIVWAMSIAVFQAALWLVLLIMLVHCVWPLERVLRESNAELPIMSQQLLYLSRWASAYWYLLVLFGLPLAIIEISVVVVARMRQNFWLSAARYACVALGSLTPLMLLLYSTVALAITIFVATPDIGP